METVLNLLASGGSTRRYVVVCFQRVSLASSVGAAVDGGLPAHLYRGLVREALCAPFKVGVDVVLAQDPGDEPVSAWIQDAAAGGHRAIVAPGLGPTASLRFRHLSDSVSQEWAMRGGLQVVEALREAAEKQLPPGIAPAYFNIAPEPQRFASLVGDETIWIDTAEGRRTSRLLGGHARVWTMDVSPAEVVPVELDTVILDLEGLEAILFWRGTLIRSADGPAPRVRAELRFDVWDEPQPPKRAAEEELAPQPTQELVVHKPDFRATAAAIHVPREPALPFVATPPSGTPTAMSGGSSSFPSALVSHPAPEPAFAVESTRDAFELDEEAELFDTQTMAPRVPDAILPFRGAPAHVEVAPPRAAPPSSLPPAPPLVVLGAPPPAPPLVLLGAPPPAPPLVVLGAPPPAPPPVVLAEPPPAPPPVVLAEPPPPPAPASSGPRQLTIEEVAAVDAEQHHDAGVAAATLERLQLTRADVDAQRERFLEDAMVESRRGKRTLQRSYDEAYLSRLEELRGQPISVAEYARLTVAAERLCTSEVLAELALPEAALLVLRRVFTDRTARDAALRKQVREGVASAREG